MERADFKNVIVENIPPALFEDAEVAKVKRRRNSKRRKFYYEKWKKLDGFEILASVKSKATSKLPYLENFHFSKL